MIKKRFNLLIFLVSMILYSLNLFSQEKNYPIEKINGIDYYIYNAESAEGVYSIGRKFNIKPDEILKHNPEIKTNGLKANQKVLIPITKKIAKTSSPQKQYIEIVIEQNQTLYSLSKKYNTTVDAILHNNEGLTPETFSIGKKILIPLSSDSELVTPQSSQSPAQTTQVDISQAFNRSRELGEINAALILPFFDATENNNNPSSPRFVEFYEGFLLALEDLKEQNISVNLFVYDIGDPNQELSSIFSRKEMQDMDIIFGPVNTQQIKIASDFAERNEVLLVLPFTSRGEEVLNNPYIYQINTPQEHIYYETSAYFTKLFNNSSNILFLEIEEAEKDDKTDLVKAMQDKLKTENIAFNTITKSVETLPTLIDELSAEKENVIIPTSNDPIILRSVVPGLRAITENDSVKNVIITLFGFPEWQKEKESFSNFYALNTYIYTTFYNDVFSKESIHFYQRFNNWYSKELLQTYPKYSILGYDTGLFFFKAIHKYGKENTHQIASYRMKGIQSGFKFEELSKESGYVNKNVFFVNYCTDFSIKKIDFNN